MSAILVTSQSIISYLLCGAVHCQIYTGLGRSRDNGKRKADEAPTQAGWGGKTDN